MKRRTVIRNVAASSLLVAGVGSAGALNRGSGSAVYELRKNGDTFKAVQTPVGGGVGSEHHCPDNEDICCEENCCDCDPCSCSACYCHKTCDEELSCDDPGVA